MNDDKKTGVRSNKWAVVTNHPWLPPVAEQIARARAWGVDENVVTRQDVSRLVLDDASNVGRTTNWPKHLPARSDFIERMRAAQFTGDQVFFATPLCVGFSAKHAESTIRGMWEAGMLVYVHTVKDNGAALYREGDDLTWFLESIAHDANNAHQRAFKARRSK